MSRRMLTTALITILAAGGFVACSDDSPVAPATGAAQSHPAGADHMNMAVTTDLSSITSAPFTVRAPVGRFRIDQPGFSIRQEGTKEIVMQQSVFAPGNGVWHTHPGPSFIYVLQGELKLERFVGDGCVTTPVYVPGNAYFEEANQVHRAVVTSVDSAVVLVTRFNIPVGAPFTVTAADPGC